MVDANEIPVDYGVVHGVVAAAVIDEERSRRVSINFVGSDGRTCGMRRARVFWSLTIEGASRVKRHSKVFRWNWDDMAENQSPIDAQVEQAITNELKRLRLWVDGARIMHVGRVW